MNKKGERRKMRVTYQGPWLTTQFPEAVSIVSLADEVFDNLLFFLDLQKNYV